MLLTKTLTIAFLIFVSLTTAVAGKNVNIDVSKKSPKVTYYCSSIDVGSKYVEADYVPRQKYLTYEYRYKMFVSQDKSKIVVVNQVDNCALKIGNAAGKVEFGLPKYHLLDDKESPFFDELYQRIENIYADCLKNRERFLRKRGVAAAKANEVGAATPHIALEPRSECGRIFDASNFELEVTSASTKMVIYMAFDYLYIWETEK